MPFGWTDQVGSVLDGPTRMGDPRTDRPQYQVLTGWHDAGVAVLVDVPMWPAHGRLWAHLVSDGSLEELHAFASRAGLPRRSFDLDHYDVPEERIPELTALGAVQVSAHELTRRLIASGLRVKSRDR